MSPSTASAAATGIAPAAGGIPLRVDHVTKRYGDEMAVDDLSFTVHPGRVTGFLGPNGSGKSTTMKVLLDLATADAGEASIGWRRYRELSDPARTVGVVLEPDAFHPGRSDRNHLRILADVAGIAGERIEEVLELVDLGHAADRRAGAYSLGMRQRLSLAAALLGDPPVLVLDEPGNGLDPQGVRELRDLLRDRAAQGHTVFLSSLAGRGRASRRRGGGRPQGQARGQRVAQRHAARGDSGAHTHAEAASRGARSRGS